MSTPPKDDDGNGNGTSGSTHSLVHNRLDTWELSRRGLLRAGAAAAAGLFVGVDFGCATPRSTAGASGAGFSPNAWLNVRTDGRLVFILDRVEMGQGSMTSLAQLVAEELEVDPAQLEVEFAPPDEAYTNPVTRLQATGGSTSVLGSWEPLRKAGASAREALRGAAAATWGVPLREVVASGGMLTHASGKSASYGSMAAAAARLGAPGDPPLKKPSQWKVLGKSVPRLDLRGKVNGSTVFGLDFQLPGMKYAVVVRCPVFGGSVKRWDATAAKARKGVADVVQIDNGIAVTADSYWTARRAARDLKIEWDLGPNAALSSEKITQTYKELCKKEGREVTDKGDAEDAHAAAFQKLEAAYEVPYLAHATMEPQNATALVENGEVTVWAPTQTPDVAKTLAAHVAGVSSSHVTVHQLMPGGGFGRRLPVDYVVEAVGIARQVKGPVKVVFSREDDLANDFYRPASYNVMKGGVDKQGRVTAWQHRIASQSVLTQVIPEWLPEMIPNWVPSLVAGMAGGSLSKVYQHAWLSDIVAIEGAAELSYGFPNLLVELHTTEPWIPVGFWRGVGHSENGFVVESFVDELAHLAKKDPYLFRREHLPEKSRNVRVLDRVAEMCGWKDGPPAGRFRGIAQHACFGSFVANVVEVSMAPELRIHRAWVAIDCGTVVNPDGVKAQMEGGMVFALSAALKQAITLKDGRVQQTNFHNYGTLRMEESPAIEVALVESTEGPGGVGETGIPAVAPALTNAIFAASGRRIRKLPVEAALAEGTQP